ncbi:MAG TPA: hypothetical protein VGX48_14065 [Pyrinomonadaceae bacterium]|jgi:hypothetical protein|nr:hypothetical protein [Pyrinomonadaceae bacterium]
MRALSAHELLDAWEKCLGRPPHERAVSLLSAFSGETAENLSRLSIGRRDRALLELRASVFGPRLTSLASCPACGERMEMDMEVGDLLVEQHGEQPSSHALRAGDYDVLFRLPDTNDLAALAPCEDASEAARALFSRCVLSARFGDGEVDAAQLPSEVLEAVGARMGEADPQGDMRLALNCTACAHAWQEAFDIGQYLWGELNAWAARTLGEVHRLAKAYGWREADILALSPQRRRIYLDMVG